MTSSTADVHGTSNAEFVAAMCRAGHIKDERVKKAFLKVRAFPHWEIPGLK
jgi:hypothetical protein